MSDLNLTVLTGRLTKNAEMSYTQNGNCICKFTLANNESRKDNNGEWYDVASFFDCTIFGKYGESMSRYLTKGRLLNVTGKLKQDRWEKDNQKYSKIQIIVSDINLLPTTKKDDGSAPSQNTTYVQNPASEPKQEEIPFDIV